MRLVIVDTTQIQSYIFGSNRLRENVGASYLVDAATGDWAFDAVKDAAPGKTNIGPKHTLRDDACIENGLDAEVLYAGGGNFVVLFSDSNKAKEFTSSLSLRALREAPGLQLVIAQREISWHKDALHDSLDEAFRTLAIQKRNQVWSAPLLGLSVTAACRSTGLPATELVPGIRGEPGYIASDEIQAKVSIATHQGTSKSLADQRLQGTIGLRDEYVYPADFDDLGATEGEYSHIAIVHADGNGIGQRIRKIGERYKTKDENRALVLALRKFSISVQDAAKKALKAVLGRLTNQILDGNSGKLIKYEPNPKISIQIKLRKNKDGHYYIPFRPIVFGGDDVTFVCDGRLGLSLATAYLHEFERYTDEYLHEFERYTADMEKDDSRLTACAGITIVKSHYPFARAYQLTVDLTKSAKRYRKEQSLIGSCLDWHFALSGLSGSIKEIREREYAVWAGSLTLRPVTLDANPQHGEQAWPVVYQGIKAFQGEDWAGRRNKTKALRDALREGPSTVEHFRTAFNGKRPLPLLLPAMEEWPSKGWQGESCGYFDAIELVDWFIPLE